MWPAKWHFNRIPIDRKGNSTFSVFDMVKIFEMLIINRDFHKRRCIWSLKYLSLFLKGSSSKILTIKTVWNNFSSKLTVHFKIPTLHTYSNLVEVSKAQKVYLSPSKPIYFCFTTETIKYQISTLVTKSFPKMRDMSISVRGKYVELFQNHVD